MSDFTNTKYETNEGLIVGARLSDLEFAVAGTPPAAAIDFPITAYTSGSRRRFGVHARGVTLTREVTVDDGGGNVLTRTFTKFLAVLTPAAFATAAFNKDAVIAIDGVNWTVLRKINENLV
jgi:hypothetical protein